jgi:hypothetical protein
MSLFTIIEILLIIILVPLALWALIPVFWILTRWQTWIPIGIVVLGYVSWYVDGARHVEKARQEASQESEERAQAFAQYVNDLKIRYKACLGGGCRQVVPITEEMAAEQKVIEAAIARLPQAIHDEIFNYAWNDTQPTALPTATPPVTTPAPHYRGAQPLPPTAPTPKQDSRKTWYAHS